MTTPDTPSAEPVANLYVHKKGLSNGLGLREGAYKLSEGIYALYTRQPTNLRAELDAMTAERDKLCNDFLEAMDLCEKWGQAYRDALAEVRKLAEELGALKGERVGWKLVPIEPTQKMINAVMENCYTHGEDSHLAIVLKSDYATMLSAAPTPEEP